jgi:hypothetical protein
MYDELKQTIMRMDEEGFTRTIVQPLLERLHPGPIEYTHSALEAGRDLVSYGEDSLGRKHVLCVQVKATPFSFSVGEFQRIADTARGARTQGVTMPSGATVRPGEVWVVNSHPFTEQKRRQVSDLLGALADDNIKVVALDELTRLLIDNLPEKAASLSHHTNAEAARLAAQLSIHSEGRAFGLAFDRFIDDFYVPAALGARTRLANLALADGFPYESRFRHGSALLTELLKGSDMSDDPSALAVHAKGRLYDMVSSDRGSALLDATVLVDIQEDDIALLQRMGDGEEGKSNIRIEYTIEIDVEKVLDERLREVRSLLDACPNELGMDVEPFLRAVDALDDLEAVCIALVSDFEVKPRHQFETEVEPPLRVCVLDPANILAFGRRVLVEGPAGCGKTTFLRVLALRLLERGEKVLYVPCHRIPNSDRKHSLIRLARENCLGNVGRQWKPNESVLVLDGLDEAPFDLAEHVARGSSKFKNVVAACRSTYATGMRDQALTLTVAPFTPEERDGFFAKWLEEDPSAHARAKDLVRKHEDIEFHTRLPLIATVAAILVGKGYEPTTRAEIYDQRLQLLLERWDRARDVRRIKVEDPKPKRRFLRQLAFRAHAKLRSRLFAETDIMEVYSKALGEWGYRTGGLESLMQDLVQVAGLIVEEHPGAYSLGHLSFQEHLTAECLFESRASPRDLAELLYDSWWREVLLFYASIAEDITEFLAYCCDDPDLAVGHASLLSEMSRCARFTSAGAREAFEEIRHQAEWEEETEP